MEESKEFYIWLEHYTGITEDRFRFILTKDEQMKLIEDYRNDINLGDCNDF